MDPIVIEVLVWAVVLFIGITVITMFLMELHHTIRRWLNPKPRLRSRASAR